MNDAPEPQERPKTRRARNGAPFDLNAVWARWAVRAAATNDPWAKHVTDFYRRLTKESEPPWKTPTC